NDKSDAGKDNDDDDQDDAERDDDDDDDDDEEDITKLDEQKDTKSIEGDAEETKSNEGSAKEETREEEEESFDPIPRSPEDSRDDGNNKEDQGLRVSGEQRLIEEEEVYELYRDQESSSVSSFVTSMLNPISDAATITTSSDAPIPPTTIPSAVLQNLSTFDSVFRFKDRVKSLEVNFSKFMQTNQENDEILRTIDENMKRIIKGQVKSQVKEQVSRILPRIEKSVNAQLEAEVLTRSSHSSKTSYAVAADLIEMELKKILIEKMEGNKSIQRSDEQQNMYKALINAYEADDIC
nr:hypothetical protein [Tanacetum cinerariifolium]